MSSVSLVPTMGALHDGHVGLFKKAGELAETVAISIFVNPSQFNDQADLTAYPRQEERDIEIAKDAGVSMVFAPTEETMASTGFTSVSAGSLGTVWEGEHRPGHFDAVATVVLRLFNIVSPDIAVFGEKDFQQCVVLQDMVNQLNLDVELHFLPTIREDSGLALSSRNKRLSNDALKVAPELFRALSAISKAALTARADYNFSVNAESESLKKMGFRIEYLSCINPITLEPKSEPSRGDRLIVAAWLDGVRLIENVQI